jgi:hypothetical protein
MRVPASIVVTALLCGSCTGFGVPKRNEHGILEYQPVATAPDGAEIKLIQSWNAPAKFQMLIRPRGDGTAYWPSNELELRYSQWQAAVAAQCGASGVTIFHGPDATSFTPDYCYLAAGDPSCGITSVGGDFSCGK